MSDIRGRKRHLQLQDMTSVRLIVAYAHMLFLLTINNLPILTGIYQNISSFHLQIFVNNDVVDVVNNDADNVIRAVTTIEATEATASVDILSRITSISKLYSKEQFEDTKGIIGIRISKKNRQYND